MRPSQLSITRNGSAVRLRSYEGTFSYFHPLNHFTGFSWDAQAASLLLGTSDPGSILMLGMGGATMGRQCRRVWPQCRITGVEADGRVVRLARSHFQLDQLGIRVVVATGQDYLRRSRARFDVVLDDIWVQRIASHLKPDGIFAVNVYRTGVRPSERLTAIKRLGATFPRIVEVRPPFGPTTVLAAGTDMLSPREVRSRISKLPPDARAAWGRLQFLSVV
jgi:spermidine synthase